MANTKVTGDLIADGTLTATNLANSSVTTDKLANSSVTAAKLNSITTDNISEGTNLFYTDARVGTYLSGNGYDTSTNIIATITDSAPTTLDTLNELAAALGDDPNFATTVTNSIATKLPLAGGTISGNLTVSGSLTGTLATAAQPTITSVGTLSSLAVSGDLTVDTDTLKVDSANNRVGIGTASPSSKLDILRSSSDRTTLSTVLSVSSQGNGPYTGFGGKISFKSNIYYGSATGAPDGIIETAYIGAVMASDYKNDSDLVFGTRQSATTVDEKMRITSSGNVGIGTTSPSSKLDIRGSGTLLSTISSNSTDGASVFYAINDSSKSCELGVWGSTRTAFGAISANNGYVFSTDDLAIGGSLNVKFGTGISNTERMRIDSSGNVGIGGTAGDGYRLQLVGTTQDGTTLGMTYAGVAAGAIKITSTGAMAFGLDGANGSTERMRIDSSGDVSIGLATGDIAQLKVRSNASAKAVLFLDSFATTEDTYTRYAAGSSDGWEVGMKGSGSSYGYVFSYGNISNVSNERMRITSDGKLLVGQTVPATGLGVTMQPDGAVFSTISSGNTFLAYNNTIPDYVFYVKSDGGVANFSANDTNLSDERTKTDINPLGSYWDKFKALELVTFKYKNQDHNDDNIGLIAQQVESVAPEFVCNDGFGETPADGGPLKTIYTTDLYHAAIKVLQEAMVKIETLEKEINDLKAQLNG